MCGIAGIFSTRGAAVPTAALQAMVAALHHRGPDDEGIWTAPALALGHRRLSIIDLRGGHQPMADAAARYHIVFNGEIYNFRELRQQLAATGTVCRTTSDTEVLLELYARHGAAALAQLQGMFALAIYDLRERRLFLARDRLGKKPLCYFLRNGTFAFASELQALRLAPGFPETIRAQAVTDYLAYQYVPGPDTVFTDVRKLPPGSSLTIRFGTEQLPAPESYWQLRFRPGAGGHPADAAAELRATLMDAVTDRLVADVPLGAFLSGGLDSTCIAGLMALYGPGPVRTFTIGFPDAAYDERRYARAAAAALGCTHAERVVEPPDFAFVRRLLRHCGEPFADASILPTYQLCRFTRESVTVALSGDGADELFGGYERYRALRLARLLDFLPLGARRTLLAPLLALLPAGRGERTNSGRLRRLALCAATPPANRYFGLLNKLDHTLRDTLLGPRLRDANPQPAEAWLQGWLARATTPEADAVAAETDLQTYLVNDILVKVDIASMAASLEVRCPFLDYRVVELAARLPWRCKQRGHARKRILASACRDFLPPALGQRRKRGFGVPLAAWLRGPWLPVLRDTLLAPECRDRGFFAPSAVNDLLKAHLRGTRDASYPLWSLLLFELWCREFDIR